MLEETVHGQFCVDAWLRAMLCDNEWCSVEERGLVGTDPYE